MIRMSESLPAWGAWIQVGMMDIRELNAVCRSPHGERGFKFKINIQFFCRSPHGERGFKFVVQWVKHKSKEVAPRMGSVDSSQFEDADDSDE